MFPTRILPTMPEIAIQKYANPLFVKYDIRDPSDAFNVTFEFEINVFP